MIVEICFCFQAVRLLKPRGTLVYSTCTITSEENERQVARALEKFPCLQLVKQVSKKQVNLPNFQDFGVKLFKYDRLFKTKTCDIMALKDTARKLHT